MAKKKRGVRIPWVKDARDDDYEPSEIDRQPHPRYVIPLKCGGCGTRVGARHGNADDPDGRASHYFKIEPHRPDCRYDLDQRGKNLVDGSAGTVVRRAGQWRLLCPPLDHLGTSGKGKGQPGGPARPGRTGGSGPRATSKQAGKAIASARRIVQILRDFDQAPEAAAEFAAVAPNGTRNIEWNDFCRGRADADQFAQALLDGTAEAIPHAVWGPASTADAVGENLDSYVVMYVARNPVRIGGKPVRLKVAVRCHRPDWIGATTRSGQVLGYGYWKLFPDDRARALSQGWIELQLWVNQPWQVTRWDTDGTTVDLPKPRPHRPKPEPGRSASCAAPTASPARSEHPDLAEIFHGGLTAGPTQQPTRAVPPKPEPSPEPEPPAPPSPPAPSPEPEPEQQEASQGGPKAPTEPAAEPSPPTAPPRPARPPLPPLPPFPPSALGEDGRDSALGRWLRKVRRSRRPG
ncbi:hypothetical protein AB0D60_36540 [Streptomyces sp. NPDC048306]|uniref:hypothetical protein n=1 Tax=Streptomyces sp. NPDC048306 TaxID=3154502 RepID=UPI0033C4AB54